MRIPLFSCLSVLTALSINANEPQVLELEEVISEIALNDTTQRQNTSKLPLYQPKDFSHLFGMEGFSDNALNLHFKLYQGYVTNTNAILGLLDQLGSGGGKDQSIYFAELKRRLMWEYDGMRLHEGYFENLGGDGSELDVNDPLFKKIRQDFGSFEKWYADFIATGVMRGVGWVVLYLDPRNGKLINAWIGEHDKGHLEGGTPLLIMDVWEHAFLPDYGLDRSKYIEAFFQNLNWSVVSNRFFKELKSRKAIADFENAQSS